MTFAVYGLPVAPGIAIGHAQLVTAGRLDMPRYLVDPADVAAELERLDAARRTVLAELDQLKHSLPADAPPEFAALLDVRLLLVQDETNHAAVRQQIREQRRNAEWALVSQLKAVARQFDEIGDEYLRARKTDVEQVTERLLRLLAGDAPQALRGVRDAEGGAPVIIAHDLSPSDLLQLKKSTFAGFVTDIGGVTGHTAIVARSLGMPAIVGARAASSLVRQGDMVVVDGESGALLVDPSPALLAACRSRQRQGEQRRGHLARLRDTPARTRDGVAVELLANIEQPADVPAALAGGATGIGLFRTEFLFMGQGGRLPDEAEQYRAYGEVVRTMRGAPVTIRTVDLGADKPLDDGAGDSPNPALGLRAIRWSLSEPEVFLIQLRAIVRAAAAGDVRLLIPMLAHASQIRRALDLVQQARNQLAASGEAAGAVRIGAMIEIPAAALTLPLFLRHFDFLSIGTNDLIQYTLAIDRADDSVAHLYDPLHPAVLQLVANTIAAGHAQGKPVTVCGEMAGDPRLTGLLLGLGLRSFSMHPAQIPWVKQEILQADTRRLQPWAQQVLHSDDPAGQLEAGLPAP